MKINNLGLFCDEFGREYEVIEEVKEVTYSPLGKPPVTREGTKSYKTKCGEHLNFANGSFITLDNVVLKTKST